MKRRLKSEGGFSLVEIIVAIALLAIVLGIAVPAYQTYIQNANLKTATRQITSDIAMLKTRALADRRQYRISFPAIPGTTYTIEQGTSTGEPYNAIQTRDLITDAPGVAISASTFDNNRIVFQMRGICSNGALTLMNIRNSSANISSSITGRINVTYTMQ